MPDLQQQLQAILGDPEAMGQITAIARALTGGAPPEGPTQTQPEAPVREVDFVPVEPPPAGPAPGPDLSALLGGGLGELDPKVIQIALRVFSEYSTQDNEKVALLAALKPFLKAERLEKMEKAEKVARLSRVVRVAVQLLKEEGDGNV